MKKQDNTQHHSPTVDATIGITTPSVGLSRIAGSIALGGVATFGIFVLMHHLTSNDDIVVVKVEPIPLISSIYQDQDETIRKIKREIEPPPPLIKAPKVPRVELTTDPISSFEYTEPSFTGIDTVPNDSGTTVFNMGAEARPIVRIPPEYPPEASREGIEGWVELSFNIDKTGAVADVNVLNSEPKRIFDRAAMRALKRWKYQAQRKEGKPVVQEGLTVMLEFTLSN